MAQFSERPSPWGGLSAILDTPAKRATAVAVILVAMVVAPFVFGPYATVIFTNALLYVVLALGLNIVVGYAGLLDLGYVAFYAVGAYMFGLLASPHLIDTFPAIKAMFPGAVCFQIDSSSRFGILQWQQR